MLGEGSCRTAEKKVEKLNKMTKFFFTPCILFYFDFCMSVYVCVCLYTRGFILIAKCVLLLLFFLL